ncbi:MAG: cell envelope integrity protein TolA [Hyphomicrobium sp.]|nr:cell envelope integrity protein TolA [Hyphomicrobium sp.]
MPFGLLVSFLCHASLLVWAFWSMRGVQELPAPDTPAISAELITPSEFLRLKQGSEDAKVLEAKANDKPTEDDSKNDTKKPDNAPPPPPPPPAEEVAAAEPPPPPEPPKVTPPPPETAPPPPPPEPAPGPTPEEQKLLEQKIEEQRLADEAQKKAEEEAKKKAEEEAKKKAEEAKKKAEEEAKKKKLAEEKKKKLAEEAKKKALEAKKFDANKLASLLEKVPDDAQNKALLDKDPKKKGQQAQGTSKPATATGKEAGVANGTDTVLSAREQDLLKGMIKSQLAQCWRLPGAGGGTEIPAVTLRWQLSPDGSLQGEPRVQNAPNDTLGNAAAESALRAVRGCQPFRLPPESYEGWRDIEWVFDPRQML